MNEQRTQHTADATPAGIKTYTINEVFYSVQGEGMRAGTANVFVRFTGCNLQCAKEPGPKSPGGFDCDTEFASGRRYTAAALIDEIRRVVREAVAPAAPPDARWLVLTGGEPALQLDAALCDALHAAGFLLAVETNGSTELPHADGATIPDPDAVGPGDADSIAAALRGYRVDWITVSPKVAEHAIRQRFAHEVKYVRGGNQAAPRTTVRAMHYLLSPAFNGLAIDPDAARNCFALVLADPKWSLSRQTHKLWNVR